MYTVYTLFVHIMVAKCCQPCSRNVFCNRRNKVFNFSEINILIFSLQNTSTVSRPKTGSTSVVIIKFPMSKRLQFGSGLSSFFDNYIPCTHNYVKRCEFCTPCF